MDHFGHGERLGAQLAAEQLDQVQLVRDSHLINLVSGMFDTSSNFGRLKMGFCSSGLADLGGL